MPGPRNPTGASRFALELDGTHAGMPASAAGGDAVAEVVVSPAGPDGIQHKQLGPVHFTDLVLTCGIGMGKPFWTWLSDTVAGTSASRDGALRIFDVAGKERERVTFSDAVVTEIDLPPLDGSSRDAFRLSVRVTAETVQRGSDAATPAPLDPRGKQALVSNFSVALDGLDLKRVARVGPLAIRRPPGGSVEIPHLELTLAEAGSESVVDWHRTFVIDGNNGDSEEKSGSISLLDPALKQSLLQIDLKGVGIFALEGTPAAGTDAISRLTARMYCEQMQLVPGQVA